VFKRVTKKRTSCAFSVRKFGAYADSLSTDQSLSRFVTSPSAVRFRRLSSDSLLELTMHRMEFCAGQGA